MGQQVLSFSVAYPGNPFDEAPYARLAARHCSSDLRTTSVGPAEVVAMLPRAVWHMDERMRTRRPWPRSRSRTWLRRT